MRTPIAATLVVCVCAFALMLSGEKLLLVLVSGENAIEYLMLAAAVLLGRYLGKTGMTFKAPLHPLVPGITLVVVAGFLVAEWLDEDAGRPSLVLLTVLCAGSIAYYWFRMRDRPGAFQREVAQE
jgi:amino acid transporter